MKMLIKKPNTKPACCFAGPHHQSLHIGFDEENDSCLRLKKVLKAQSVYLIKTLGVAHFISGVDLGVGQFAAEIVLDLKRDYPEITLECVIPYEDQAAKWTIAQRDRYFSIMERCDKETLLQRHYTKDCMKKRKEYMVKQSNYVLAVCNSKLGGAGNILSFAHTLGKTVVQIDPNTFEVHFDSNQYSVNPQLFPQYLPDNPVQKSTCLFLPIGRASWETRWLFWRIWDRTCAGTPADRPLLEQWTASAAIFQPVVSEASGMCACSLSIIYK